MKKWDLLKNLFSQLKKKIYIYISFACISVSHFINIVNFFKHPVYSIYIYISIATTHIS